MSNWSMDEVRMLSDEAGGGNLNARNTWLGNLDHLILTPIDPLDRYVCFSCVFVLGGCMCVFVLGLYVHRWCICILSIQVVKLGVYVYTG